MIQPTLSFGRRPVRPRLCADLPLVYRSVRTVRTHDRPARRRVKARPSHRRSIACAALLSFAGASRQAQHIRRRCATRPSAGLHSHAPRPMLKPDGGRSGGVSVSGCASRTRKHALVKSRVVTMRHKSLPGAKRRPGSVAWTTSGPASLRSHQFGRCAHTAADTHAHTPAPTLCIPHAHTHAHSLSHAVPRTNGLSLMSCVRHSRTQQDVALALQENARDGPAAFADYSNVLRGFHERLDLMEGHGRRAAGGRPTS
jgi:hypothetical protein